MSIGPVRAGLGSISLEMPRASAASTTQAQHVDVGQQVRQSLFGKPKPPAADPAKYPHLAELLQRLGRFKAKFAQLAGDDEDEYDFYLAHGTIACIDEDGHVAVGVEFLEAFREQPEVIAGVVAHEIGHRPKRWKAYRGRQGMTRAEIEDLCRFEETRADIFAGRALAELDLSYEGLARLLGVVQPEDEPHPGYYPSSVRVRVIKEAWEAQHERAELRKRLFPAVERLHAPAGYIGRG